MPTHPLEPAPRLDLARLSGSTDFFSIGLLCERTPDGHAVCNIPLLGADPCMPRVPDWGRPCAAGFTLALSCLIKVLHEPDLFKGPLAPLMSQSFYDHPQNLIVLDDGTRVSAWESHLAKRFSARYIEGHPDRDTLTLSVQEIIQRYAALCHETYPDHPQPSQA